MKKILPLIIIALLAIPVQGAFYDPISDVVTDWTGGTSGVDGHYVEVDDGVRQPTDPGTDDYNGQEFFDGNTEEYSYVVSSANEITEITVWSNVAMQPTGFGMSLDVAVKIGASYTSNQTISDQSRAWVSKTFNESSDPSLFPISAGTAINVRYQGTTGGPGTRIDLYATYADYTESVAEAVSNPQVKINNGKLVINNGKLKLQ